MGCCSSSPKQEPTKPVRSASKISADDLAFDMFQPSSDSKMTLQSASSASKNKEISATSTVEYAAKVSRVKDLWREREEKESIQRQHALSIEKTTQQRRASYDNAHWKKNPKRSNSGKKINARPSARSLEEPLAETSVNSRGQPPGPASSPSPSASAYSSQRELKNNSSSSLRTSVSKQRTTFENPHHEKQKNTTIIRHTSRSLSSDKQQPTNATHESHPSLANLQGTFGHRLSGYQEGLNEIAIRNTKRKSTIEHDRRKNDVGIDEKTKEAAYLVIEEQARRKSIEAGEVRLFEENLKNVDEMSACECLRNLNVLIDDDRVLHVTPDVMLGKIEKLVPSDSEKFRKAIVWVIANNSSLQVVKLTGCGINNNYLKELIQDGFVNSQSLSEIYLESNPITDRGVDAMCYYVQSNPVNLRILKMGNAFGTTSTQNCERFCNALKDNYGLVKVTFDMRWTQHVQLMDKYLRRNNDLKRKERRESKLGREEGQEDVMEL